MAPVKTTEHEDFEEESLEDLPGPELLEYEDEDQPELDDDDLEDDDEDEEETVDVAEKPEASEEDDEETKEKDASLDPLEVEEMEAVESNDPATMLVDEASEIKAIRRQEMIFDLDNEERRSDEFVCESCFLVRNKVQMAFKRKKVCVDCA